VTQVERKPAHEVILSRIGIHLLSGDTQIGRFLILELLEVLDGMTIPKDEATTIAQRIEKLQVITNASLHNRISRSLAGLRSLTSH